MTEMNTTDTDDLFTISQAANACSVSRATLLRMEAEGLLTPALHEEGKYRYYSTDNVTQALQIYTMHRMGLTHKEIHPLVDDPGDIDAVIAQLEHLRDNLNEILTHLKKRTMKDSSTVTEMLRLPETLCYVRTYELEGGRYDLRQYIRDTLTDAIRAGCRLDWERVPFMRVQRPDLAEGRVEHGVYRYRICVPVTGHPKNCGNIETVRSRQVLSVTWHGEVTDLAQRTLTLAADARAMDLKPTGWFHVILERSVAETGANNARSNVLQLGCIVE